ncbi:ABC transporter permease [Lacrimispora amygdalina]|uniref:ABC transporter permease n=1 Tax=Lacrimispora amygdalina TaxID=253257 RepID=A0A3E2ND68_9FIRM|nr:ABC transporter permease [Clostridium indicum]RFZ78969.1 ABC transporter permease [Clostridium indicum]
MKKSNIAVIGVIIVLNFFLPRLMPGDPFLYLSVEDGNTAPVYSSQQIKVYEEYYGLDKPLHEQLIRYLTGIVKGDLGYSIFYHEKVTDMIAARIPWTLLIVISALVLSSVFGTMLGTICAWHRDSFLDRCVYFFMMVLSEIPGFLIGIFLLFYLGANLKWFPMSGGETVFASYSTPLEQVKDIIHHMVLPVLTLSLSRLGSFYLLSRSSMLNVLSKDYIRTAKGKGLKKHTVILKHGLKNSLPPVVTQFFMSLGAMVGQAVLVENVFSYPGAGSLMREAVVNRDYVLMQGIFLIMSATVLIMNGLAEFMLKKMDPRMV